MLRQYHVLPTAPIFNLQTVRVVLALKTKIKLTKVGLQNAKVEGKGKLEANKLLC